MIMNITKAKVYLIPAAVCLLGIIALLYYYFFTGFSTCEKTEYLYIDESDTPETVFQKLEPYASKHGMTALRTLLRHSNYAQHMRTGRYVLEPTDGVLTIGMQFASDSQYFVGDVKLRLVGAADGFDYAAAYATGIEAASAAKVARVELYDLNGQRIPVAKKGIFVMKKYLSNGDVVTEKVVKP